MDFHKIPQTWWNDLSNLMQLLIQILVILWNQMHVSDFFFLLIYVSNQTSPKIFNFLCLFFFDFDSCKFLRRLNENCEKFSIILANEKKVFIASQTCVSGREKLYKIKTFSLSWLFLPHAFWCLFDIHLKNMCSNR